MKKLLTLLCLYHTISLAQFPETLELSELNGQDGFVFNGANAFDYTGYSVKSAGDLNGNGLTDLIVGSDGADQGGKVYLVFSQKTGYNSSYEVSDLVENFGVVIDNPESSGLMGWSVDGLGDVNGDGIDDIIFGIPRSNTDIGRAYVVFGDAAGFPEGIDLSELNGNNGFLLNGETTSFKASLGRSVSTAGDINNDGFLDIAVASPRADFNGMNTGSVYVIYGTDQGYPSEIDLNVPLASIGFRLNGDITKMNLGWRMSSLGDVNGDGFDDLGLSTEYFTMGFGYVLYGNANGFPVEFNMSNIDGTNGFRIHPGNDTTTGIYSAGDFNGDGRADISIGTTKAPNESGNAYVLYGRSEDFPVDVHVSDLDGNAGFSIINPDTTNTIRRIGVISGTAGDINSDGIDDLFVSESNDPTSSGSQNRLGFIIFGSTTLNQPIFNLADLDGQNGFKVNVPSFTSAPWNAFPVAALDDMNGDGINDFAIGNQGAETHGARSGAVYVVFGKAQDMIFKNGFE